MTTKPKTKTTTIDLSTAYLSIGKHDPDGVYCAMELASVLAGEGWSDHPKCVSPVIGAYVRSINDNLPDADRQRLLDYIPRMLNTVASPEVEQRRGYLCADYVVRVFAPIAFDMAGLPIEAEKLRALAPVTDKAAAEAAGAAGAAGAVAGAKLLTAQLELLDRLIKVKG